MDASHNPNDHSYVGWQVALVGAGPGDPGLLTLRGAEMLRRCDVVLYDGLSNQDLLRHAPQAEHISVGKHGQSRIWTQPEIIDEILSHARSGRRVVRLKGGDPAVFARTSEEVDAIRQAGMTFEIVPGITAALAAGSFAGIPITHRGLASAVALVTGHEEPGKSESDLDWEALAKFPGTLVIYMGVTTARRWTSELIQHGKSGDTPVAIVRRCSHPDQQIVHCNLSEVAERLTPASKMRPPVISIVGDVTRLSEAMSWFDRRPLFGTTVLNTRPNDPDCELTEALRNAGANVVSIPAIEIRAVEDMWLPNVEKSLGLAEPHASPKSARANGESAIVFCSANGVRYFFERIFAAGHDARALAGCRIAAVGTKTADAIRRYHVNVDIIPDTFRGDAVADTLIAADVKSCLIVRANRGDNAWVEKLRSGRIDVTQVEVYENRDVDSWPDGILREIQADRVDWIAATSSATASNIVRLVGDDLSHVKVASLSDITTGTLQSHSVQVDAEAKHATMKSLADAIIDAEAKQDLNQESNR